MPYYVFTRVDDPSVTEDRFYHMHDAPSVGSVITDAGVKWRRVFTRPQASIDTHVDPFSSRDFIKATAKKGNVGDLFDRSKELSLKRAEKEGSDPLRQAHFDAYSKRRHGKKHPEQQREESVKTLKKQGIVVDWGSDD